MRALLPACVACAAMLAVRPGAAQQFVDKPSEPAEVRVGDEEAPPGCRPYVPNTLMPGHCRHRYFLYREDGVNSRVVSWPEGTWISGGILTCDFCSQCCQDVPYNNYCVETLEVSDSRSFQFQFAAGIRNGQSIIRRALEAYAEGILGYTWQTSHTWSVAAGSEAMPPCTRGKWMARAFVRRGVVIATDSVYHWRLEFWGGPDCNASFDAGTCSEVRTSTLTSTWWADLDVMSLPTPPCRG